MADKHKKAKPAHGAGSSRRIKRRLSPSAQQQGLSAEAEHVASAPQASRSRKKQRTGGVLSFFQRTPKPKSERPQKRFKWLKRCLLAFAILLVCAGAFLVIYVNSTTQNDFLWLDLEQIPYKDATVLYAKDPDETEWQVYATLPSTQYKEYIEGSRMPQQLKDAFVAIEDKDFYNHSGVSFKRTLYAFVNEAKYIFTGSYIGGDSGRRQGASTIDQQLIKNLTRDDESNSLAGYLRKVQEIWRALKLDKQYDKDTILEAYLNTISFTGNTAGVQAEAQKLFGKDADQLTLAECASLAAITRNPSRYNPVNNPEEHLNRRNYVLSEMADQGYITAQQAEEAQAEPLNLDYQGEPVREQEVTSYFTDALMESVIGELGDEYGLSRAEATHLLYNGGLRIYTTVSPTLQASMEEVMETASVYPRRTTTVNGALVDDDGEPLLDEDGNQLYGDIQITPQAAMVSLDYDGGVAAVVGGLGEKTISRGFNRGTSAVRQVGSTMKPIGPYAVAFEENRITWSSAFLDSPVGQEEDEKTGEMVDWPKNVTNTYTEKDILVKDAMARSVNTIAVRVGEVAGTRSIYNFVKNKLEITTIVRKDAKPGPMVLGSSTYGITPLEMAKAYAMFGNGGQVPEVRYFINIENGAGTVLLRGSQTSTQAISEDTAYVMNRLLRQVMIGDGTASGMSVPGDMDSVGKTGTTSDHRDHWFIGLTPYYVTASWYGYDENIELQVDSRNHPPTLAWRRVMQEGQAGLPARQFPVDSTVVEAAYCTTSGYAAGSSCPSATGYYRSDNLPKQGCPVHG